MAATKASLRNCSTTLVRETIPAIFVVLHGAGWLCKRVTFFIFFFAVGVAMGDEVPVHYNYDAECEEKDEKMDDERSRLAQRLEHGKLPREVCRLLYVISRD